MVRRKAGTTHSLSIYVGLSIVFVVFYSIAEFICSTITGVSHETLTVSIYTFFGTEIALSGFIKIFKIRRNDNDNISG